MSRKDRQIAELTAQRDQLLQENIAATTLLADLMAGLSLMMGPRSGVPDNVKAAIRSYLQMAPFLAEEFLKDPGRMKALDIDLITPRPPNVGEGTSVWEAVIADIAASVPAGHPALLMLEDIRRLDIAQRAEHGAALVIEGDNLPVESAYLAALEAVGHTFAQWRRTVGDEDGDIGDAQLGRLYTSAVNLAISLRRKLALQGLADTRRVQGPDLSTVRPLDPDSPLAKALASGKGWEAMSPEERLLNDIRRDAAGLPPLGGTEDHGEGDNEGASDE